MGLVEKECLNLNVFLNQVFGDIAPFVEAIYYYSEDGNIALANPNTMNIHINKFYFDDLDMDEKIDTIRHEFAHIASFIINFSYYGQFYRYGKDGRCLYHGKEWKKWARYLGARPRATVVLTA